ncbi:hypothetical protein GCM10017687_07410 [Streptomyces echinatus]
MDEFTERAEQGGAQRQRVDPVGEGMHQRPLRRLRDGADLPQLVFPPPSSRPAGRSAGPGKAAQDNRTNRAFGKW